MATSLQSKVTGCATVAFAAGEISAGAAGAGGAAGFTVSAAVRVTPAKTAEIVAEVEAVTEVVVTVKLAVGSVVVGAVELPFVNESRSSRHSA
ncbi:MAG: hypothetical protein HYU51_17970 [Candidatus Rokubacteria bacterium]|nr:hypothetical protein [Candidatus Rokubacteria bacterium]